MLHVWTVPLARDACLDAHRLILSSDERQRAEQFARDEPRQRFILARSALRHLLSRYLRIAPRDLTVVTDANGKPRLKGARAMAQPIHFNLAHSGELALIAVAAECEVGVDVERVRPVAHTEHISRRYFHTSECRAIEDSTRLQRDLTFMRIWTAKEAILKAVGTGVTGSLSHFCVPLQAPEGAWVALPTGRCWLQFLEPNAGYVGAVACVGEKRRICCFAP